MSGGPNRSWAAQPASGASLDEATKSEGRVTTAAMAPGQIAGEPIALRNSCSPSPLTVRQLGQPHFRGHVPSAWLGLERH